MIKIEGFDTARAVEMLGGDENLYLDVLDAFCEDTEKWREIIAAYPAKTTLKSFATSVHGFKSAAREVGAAAAGDYAFEIEKAVKAAKSSKSASDIAFVKERHAELLEVMDTLISRCRAALSDAEKYNKVSEWRNL